MLYKRFEVLSKGETRLGRPEKSLIKVSYSRHQDLLTACGFLAALQACRRLARGSTVWLGVPRAQWIWLSRGTTKRCHLRPKGSKRRYKAVRLANRLVRRVCFLFLGCTFAWPRHVQTTPLVLSSSDRCNNSK